MNNDLAVMSCLLWAPFNFPRSEMILAFFACPLKGEITLQPTRVTAEAHSFTVWGVSALQIRPARTGFISADVKLDRNRLK